MALAAFIKLLFVLAVGSSVFLMVVWAAATVYRVLYPERTVPILDRWVSEGETEEPIGVEQIRDDRDASGDRREAEYRYSREEDSWWRGRSRSIPEQWTDDLWRRRN